MKEYILMDLQLFAMNVQTTTATPPTSDGNGGYANGLSDEMKTYYNKTLIERAKPKLVHAQFGEKVSIPPNGGKTIEFREFSAFPKATTPLTEGVTPDGVPLEVTAITKTLAQFGAYTAVSDTLELTAIDNIIVETTGRHADSMGLTLDTITRNELNTATHVIYAPTSLGVEVSQRSGLTGDCKLTLNLIAKAVTELKKANAPKFDGSYVGIIHPSVSYDLMTHKDWIDVNKYANVGAIFDGEIGKLFGVRFVETTEAAYFKGSDGGTNGEAVYSCLFIGKGAYKVIDVASAGARIIVKPKGSAGTADPLDQRSTIGWKIPLYGAKIVINDYIVRVECGSTFSIVDAGSDYTAPQAAGGGNG